VGNYTWTMKNNLLALTLLILMTGCFPEEKYKITEDSVYLTGWNEGTGDYILRVKEADPGTFETIETDCNCVMGKDKDHVFHEKTLIENADPKTFRYIGQYYFADSDSVYFFGSYNNVNDCEVWGASPTETKVYEQYPWAHDERHLIHGHTVTRLSDLNDLKIINENWARSTDKIFYMGVVLDSVDLSTFEVMSKTKARDKRYVYLDGDTYIRKYN
jgi:hypothetical protein